MQSLIINEIFYSIQGESSRSGIPTIFIRLTGCPLRCSYCDTDYAFTEGRKYTFDKILDEIKKYKTNYITVTGGEPLSQTNTISLLKDICDKGYSVSLETSNGVLINNVDKRVSVILDIKTPSSKEEDNNIIDNYNFLKPIDEIKFVICNKKDFEWSVRYIDKHNLKDKCPILFSPSHNQMRLDDLADLVLENNLEVRLQHQFHKTIWGNLRGK